MTASVKKPPPHPDDIRRSYNLQLGMRLIEAGIPVFVSYDKTSMIPKWNRLDSELTEVEREEARQKRKREGKPAPTIIGSTLDAKTWERMQRLVHRDGTASICCGLAKIVVIDADKGEDKVDGPALLAAYLDEHGGVPEGTLILTSQSGAKHYVFADPDGKYSNAEGQIKRVLGCNVRGVSGQIVAPGSWRADGKRYGTMDDLHRFIDAITLDTLPELPQCLADLIGEQSGQSLSDSDPRIQAGIAELNGEEWPEYADVFGPGKKLDVERIKKGSDKFRELIDNPRPDRSANRLSLASALKGASSHATVRDFATFCGEYPETFGELVDKHEGSGTYTVRNLAKDFTAATPANVSQSEGNAFGAVDEEAEAKADKRSKLQAEIAALDSAIAALKVATASGESTQALERARKRTAKELAKLEAQAAKPALFSAEQLEVVDLETLPPMPFVYRQWLAKGELTVFLAPGATGKSVLTLSMLADISCGVDHLGAEIKRPRATLLRNVEDSQLILQKRLSAYAKFHNFTDEELALVKQNLHVKGGPDKNLASQHLVTADRNGITVNEELLQAIVDYLKVNGIEVAIFDPVNRLHNVNENDNTGMAFVATVFDRIAKEANVAVAVVHHTRKLSHGKGATELDSEDSRGASALINAARMSVILNTISPARADEFQIVDKPERYFSARLGSKANHSAKDRNVLVYYLNSVAVDNATDEYAADNLPAISQHKFTRTVGIGEDATERVLARLDGGEPVGSDSRHANWLGKIIAEEAGWDIDVKATRATIKELIADWTRRRWIVSAVMEANGRGSDRRRPVGIYKRGEVRPERRAYQFGAVVDED
ncbi:AAA family ATPase [Bradyrhizobium sp. USDA 10063]